MKKTKDFCLRLMCCFLFLGLFCGTEVFAILNLKQYISKEELQQFYASVFYEKVFLLLIEGNFSGKEKNEKCLIYDKDCCIIEA